MQLYFMGNPTWQIRDAWERAKPYNPGMLLIAVEDTAPVGAQVRWNKLWEALFTCREIGATPGIYTAKWFWNGYMAQTQAFREFPLWVAEYDNQATMDWSGLPYYGPFGGWDAPTIRQFSNSVGVAGVYCDLNCRIM